MNRLLYAAPALACAGLLAFGYYLQYFDYQDPCPLCLVQRGFYYGILLVFAVAALHSPGRTGKMIYCAAATVFALGGLGGRGAPGVAAASA
jgi:disulfide bond formation protein DsbB